MLRPRASTYYAHYIELERDASLSNPGKAAQQGSLESLGSVVTSSNDCDVCTRSGTVFLGLLARVLLYKVSR